ncbi:MAG: DMT family transporter [Pseudomonadota bacterium]|nr:DMT family transporter [Pseudomonadota bacterium]
MLFKSGLAALSKSPSVLTGLVIAVVAMFLFSLTHTSVRLMSDTMTAFQIVFWRMLLSMAMLMPWYAWQGFGLLKTRRPGMHALRAAVNCGGMLLWFFAIAVVPLGKAVAIHFVLPIFVMVLAVIVLRERVGIRRMSAALVGFGGVLLVLRPNEFGIGWPEIMILGSALCYATTVIFLKYMVKSETPLALTFYTNFFILLFTIPPTIWFWVPPSVDDIFPILAIGVTGTFAPLLYTTALRIADASIIAATDFLRLPITAGLAFALFGEVPDIWVWIGGGTIFLSTWYIAVRESRLEKSRKDQKKAR